MGRLENIIARNQRGNRRFRERTVVMMVVGLIILLILVLFVFTDLGMPPDLDPPRVAPEPPRITEPPPGSRADGIKLWRPPAKASGSAAVQPR